WAAGKLADKAASAMTSAQNPHGGQETTLLSMYVTIMHFGCILVPPGYTDPVIYASGGNPYGTTTAAGGEGLSEEVRASIRYQAQRLVEFAGRIAKS
ncbi:MAG TPA: hypothetical protein VM759_04750, partial [Longimicrobium sp.]|nr:hypothetical protein [Longimicrobium sp.]